MNLSVVIITFNEERNIGRCLRSLPSGCDVIVIDSCSSDRTVEVCSGYGARVENRVFKNYSDQKNYGLSLAKCDWVLSLDADEVLSEGCRFALGRITHSEVDYSAYRLQRQLVFMGRKMKWGRTVDFPLRLFRSGSGRFVGSIHEKYVIDAGQVCPRPVKGILHYSYMDLTDYFNRFNRYTSLIAESKQAKPMKLDFFRHLCRPWYEFLHRYFFCLGALDGYPGYVYALSSSLYAFVKYSKVYEKGLPFEKKGCVAPDIK